MFKGFIYTFDSAKTGFPCPYTVYLVTSKSADISGLTCIFYFLIAAAERQQVQHFFHDSALTEHPIVSAATVYMYLS